MDPASEGDAGVVDFDIESFLASKLGNAFTEGRDQVGVVVLAPAEEARNVEAQLAIKRPGGFFRYELPGHEVFLSTHHGAKFNTLA